MQWDFVCQALGICERKREKWGCSHIYFCIEWTFHYSSTNYKHISETMVQHWQTKPIEKKHTFVWPSSCFWDEFKWYWSLQPINCNWISGKQVGLFICLHYTGILYIYTWKVWYGCLFGSPNTWHGIPSKSTARIYEEAFRLAMVEAVGYGKNELKI